MKNLLFLLILLGLSFSAFSQKKSSLNGKWSLVSWSVDLQMDLNRDGKSSSNLITETKCNNQEILTIDENGMLKSDKTFNPTVNISKSGNTYKISEKCNKGNIGFSNAFERQGSDLNLDNGGKYKLVDGNLVRVFEDAVNVFNSTYSEVLETKNLTLIYKKQ